MKAVLKVIFIGILFCVLTSIRFFELQLFYDPLIEFFHGNYLNGITPEFEFWKLVLHTTFRFLLNTSISLLILYIAFKDLGILKFSAVLYGILLVVLMLVFCIMLSQSDTMENFMPLFYVRRFLIQPILIILLLPAFYYYKKQQD